MNEPISDLPKKEQGGLLSIDGDTDAEEPCMFERGMYFCVLYFCVMSRINQQICCRNRYFKKGIQTLTMRRISQWKTVGRITGGIFLRMAGIRVRFMTLGGMSTQEIRRSL